jgi:hypothetical protein
MLKSNIRPPSPGFESRATQHRFREVAGIAEPRLQTVETERDVRRV